MLRSSVFSKVFIYIVLKFRANFAPPLRLVLFGQRQAMGMHRTFISINMSQNTLFHVSTLVLMLYERYTTKDSQLISFSSLAHGA